MPSIGLKKLYIAKYDYDSSTGEVTYSDGMSWRQPMTMNISGGNSEVSKLYGGDTVAETYQNMTEASITLGVTEMPFDVYALMFSREVENVTLTGSPSATGKRLTDGGDGDTPYLGLGVIAPKVVGGKRQFMAVIVKKTQFKWPDDDFETLGENVVWKTPSLSGTVMREDGGGKAMRDYTIWDSEDNAEKYIKQVLNISEPTALEA